MKRWISLCLAALLVFGALHSNVYAADSDVADAEGTVSWENLHSRIQTGSLNTQELSEQIASLNAIDYDKMLDDLKKQLNDLASLQWYIVVSGGVGSYESASYDSLKEVYESVRDGELEQDNADTIRQLEDACNQILLAGDRLYINILMLEQALQLQEQALSSIERSIREANLYEQYGMTSAYDIAALNASKTELESSIESQRINIRGYKAQLQSLMGEEATGELTLTAPPLLDEDILAERSYSKDLEAAKDASWSLAYAKIVLDDAEQDFKDIKKDYAESSYQYQSAQHSWQAAQLSYEAAVQDFETSFQTSYDAVTDAAQQLDSKHSATVYQAFRLSIAQLRFEQGMISRSALYTAEEEYAATQGEEALAQYQLFLACHCYTQAVEQGILTT